MGWGGGGGGGGGKSYLHLSCVAAILSWRRWGLGTMSVHHNMPSISTIHTHTQTAIHIGILTGVQAVPSLLLKKSMLSDLAVTVYIIFHTFPMVRFAPILLPHQIHYWQSISFYDTQKSVRQCIVMDSQLLKTNDKSQLRAVERWNACRLTQWITFVTY